MPPAQRAAERDGAIAVAANLLIVYVIWGSTYLAIRVMVETIPPFLGAAARFIVAGAAMYTILLVRSRLSRSPDAAIERVTWREWRTAAIVGGLLLLGGNGFVVQAERHIDSGIAAVLVAAVPIWMNLIDAVVHRRRPSWLAMGGVGAGFVGVAILLAPVSGVSSIDPLGIGLVLFAGLSWAIGSLYSRHAPMPRSGLLATAMEMLAGGLLLALASVATGEPARTNVAAFSVPSVLAVGYLLVFGSLVAFSSYTWLLQRAPVSIVATYAYVNPVVAVALGAIFLSEPITPRTLLASALIIGAVIAMVSGRPREAASAPSEGAADELRSEAAEIGGAPAD